MWENFDVAKFGYRKILGMVEIWAEEVWGHREMGFQFPAY
jgi:hypothetical protein